MLYAMIARQPVGQLWLAGVFPGLMMAAMFILYIYVRCRLQPHLGPPLPAEERNVPLAREAPAAARRHPAASSSSSSMTGLFLARHHQPDRVERGRRAGRDARRLVARAAHLADAARTSIRQTLGISAMFLWIILAALCFGAVFDGLGAGRALAQLFVEGWGLGPWEILMMMQLSFIIMGMFLDDTAMLVIVAPLYVPLVIALGFDPVWYGVLYTITCQIAYITPPFGYNLFLMRAMAPPEITLPDIYRSIVPFVLIMLVALGDHHRLPADRALAAAELRPR